MKKSLIIYICIALFSLVISNVNANQLIDPLLPNSARLSFQSSNNELAETKTDFVLRNEDTLINTPSLYLTGNGILDSNAKNSYNTINLEFDAENSVETYALIIEKPFGTDGDVNYEVYVGQSSGSTVTSVGKNEIRKYDAVSNELDEISFNGIKNLVKDAAEGGVTLSGFANSFSSTNFLSEQVDGTVIIGDPDHLTNFTSKIYTFVRLSDKSEYAFVTEIKKEDPNNLLNNTTKAQQGSNILRIELPFNSSTHYYEVEIENTGTFYTSQRFSLHDIEENKDYLIQIQGYDIYNEKTDEILTIQTQKAGDLPNFTDTTGTTFETQIDLLRKFAIVNGYSDNTFRPENSITRGELSKFVVNTFKIPVANSNIQQFSDLNLTHSHYHTISALIDAGIVNGFSDNTFKPDNPVTRAEATKFILNAANYYNSTNILTSSDCIFNDVEGHILESYVCGLYNSTEETHSKLMNGYPDGSFRPNNNLTRGEMSKIILNTGVYFEINDDAPGPDKTIGTSDDGDDLLGTDFGTTNDTFLNVNQNADRVFRRPFLEPLPPAEFIDDTENSYQSIDIEWREQVLSDDDDSVDGYIFQMCEADANDCTNESNWEDINEDNSSFGGQKQLIQIQILSANAGETYYINYDGRTYGYTATGTDTTTTIATSLASAARAHGSIEWTSSGDTITGQTLVAGENYTFTTNSSLPGILTGVTEFQSGEIANRLEDGVLNLNNLDSISEIIVDEDDYLAQLSILDLDEDEKYAFRIASFKFLPYHFIDKDLNSQEQLENPRYYDTREYMLVSDWIYLETSTKDGP